MRPTPTPFPTPSLSSTFTLDELRMGRPDLLTFEEGKLKEAVKKGAISPNEYRRKIAKLRDEYLPAVSIPDGALTMPDFLNGSDEFKQLQEEYEQTSKRIHCFVSPETGDPVTVDGAIGFVELQKTALDAMDELEYHYREQIRYAKRLDQQQQARGGNRQAKDIVFIIMVAIVAALALLFFLT